MSECMYKIIATVKRALEGYVMEVISEFSMWRKREVL